jgi:nitronate monooxygenase
MKLSNDANLNKSLFAVRGIHILQLWTTHDDTPTQIYRVSLMPKIEGSTGHAVHQRVDTFCRRYGLRMPILQAPMAGASPASLAIAVANAGGMGAHGALPTAPEGIHEWANDFKAKSNGSFQLNTWIPDPPPLRDAEHESQVRNFLGDWGPSVAPEAGDARPPDFAKQCATFLDIAPPVVSSIMGVFPPEFVQQCKRKSIAWFACVTTLAEALKARDVGADAIVVQGIEAGGHRGSFDAAAAERQGGTLFSLLPRIADKITDVPLIATGGIGDGRGIAAALVLGASAVQIGTALLRCPEAKTNRGWADALVELEPEGTMATRAFTGRLGRTVATNYAIAASGPAAPRPAPYPVQRGLTTNMKELGQRTNDIHRIQAWAGQAGAFAREEPAAEFVRRIWADAQELLP